MSNIQRQNEVNNLTKIIKQRRKDVQLKLKHLKSNISVQRLYYNLRCSIQEEHMQYTDTDDIRILLESPVRYD